MISPRLVVAGPDPSGQETCLRDESVEPVTASGLPGQEMYLLWGSADGGARVGVPPSPQVLPFFAGPGGTRLLLVRFPPSHAVPPVVGDPSAVAAETDEKLPGLMDVFEQADSRMHTTDTLDYGILLEGELWLELDDGKETHLTPGTCVVQLGTRHAWHNRGAVPALMAFVGIGAVRG